MHTNHLKAAALAGVLFALYCGTAAAQNAQARPDFSGIWLVQDPGSGSFGGWMNSVPKPELKPEIIAQNEEAAKHAMETVFHNLNDHTGCTEGGYLTLMMASSPALSLVTSKDEVLLAGESGRARFIYTDGRQHADIKSPKYKPTGFGDSIGHWEGETLVVDTIGFPQRMCGGRAPYIETPRGGRMGPNTHLTERFHMSPDGQMLTVTFTWEDPGVFLKPHTYSYNFKHLEGAEPFESQDDQRDAAYQQRLRSSTIAPPQK